MVQEPEGQFQGLETALAGGAMRSVRFERFVLDEAARSTSVGGGLRSAAVEVYVHFGERS